MPKHTGTSKNLVTQCTYSSNVLILRFRLSEKCIFKDPKHNYIKRVTHFPARQESGFLQYTFLLFTISRNQLTASLMIVTALIAFQDSGYPFLPQQNAHYLKYADAVQYWF